MMELLTDPQSWLALLALTAIEIVLGIDNIIFISIFASRLPDSQRNRARLGGLSLALATRILLLLALSWIMSLVSPFVTVFGHGVSGRDLLLIAGGLFLLTKSTLEIHNNIAPGQEQEAAAKAGAGATGFWATIVQIGLIDIVFSLDSVITAVGMANTIEIMIVAVILAILVMMAASASVSRFIETHPTFKVLALSFLVLIGVALIADGIGLHIPKGYIYFAMAFSFSVEMVNMRLRTPNRNSSPPSGRGQ